MYAVGHIEHVASVVGRWVVDPVFAVGVGIVWSFQPDDNYVAVVHVLVAGGVVVHRIQTVVVGTAGGSLPVVAADIVVGILLDVHIAESVYGSPAVDSHGAVGSTVAVDCGVALVVGGDVAVGSTVAVGRSAAVGGEVAVGGDVTVGSTVDVGYDVAVGSCVTVDSVYHSKLRRDAVGAVHGT